MQAETEAAFHLTFFLVELIGKDEAGEISEEEAHLLRLLTSLAKLTTGKQAVTVTSEVLEAFGGAGYVEDTGLPVLLRDSQVLPIWEGTTNVLSLDALRALGRSGEPLLALANEVDRCVNTATDGRLKAAGEVAETAVAQAMNWLQNNLSDRNALEAGARRFALTLGRSLALVKLVEQAQWSLDVEGDGRARAAACRFAQTSINQIVAMDPADAAALADDL
jgi:hypothetical protein